MRSKMPKGSSLNSAMKDPALIKEVFTELQKMRVVRKIEEIMMKRKEKKIAENPEAASPSNEQISASVVKVVEEKFEGKKSVGEAAATEGKACPQGKYDPRRQNFVYLYVLRKP